MSDYTKLITTRLKLDGEAEYNNKISQISKSMGGMKSEMSKLSAEYAGQLNSYEALTKKGDILTRQLDAQKQKQSEVTKMLDEAKKARDRINESISKTVKEMEDESKANGTLSSKYIELKSALEDHETSATKAANSISHFEKELNHADASVARANTSLNQNTRYLYEAGNSADNCAKSINEYGNEVKVATEKTNDLTEMQKMAVAGLATALSASLIKNWYQDLNETLRECIRTSMDFDRAMSVIASTTQATA